MKLVNNVEKLKDLIPKNLLTDNIETNSEIKQVHPILKMNKDQNRLKNCNDRFFDSKFELDSDGVDQENLHSINFENSVELTENQDNTRRKIIEDLKNDSIFSDNFTIKIEEKNKASPENRDNN